MKEKKDNSAAGLHGWAFRMAYAFLCIRYDVS
jgi:hypothetical protein